MSNEEFEKWWCEAGTKFITEKLACFGAWQEKQREIDALKHKLAVTDDGFRAAETLLKNHRSENDALKAEVEQLRKDAERWNYGIQYGFPINFQIGWRAVLRNGNHTGGRRGFANATDAIDAAIKETK